MIDDDFRVEVIGHAALRVQAAGRTLLTDPWLLDPIVCDSSFHFPPLVHDPGRLARETDAIYVSHPHPDHFHPASLALFSRDVPVYIGCYRRKEFRDRVSALGFPVVEVPFQEPVRVAGTAIEICLVEHDQDETATFDSAIAIRTPEFTLFENNDCRLGPAKYAWLRERFAVDYAFLGYSPASFFPICFEMDAGEKARLLQEAAEHRYGDFVRAARMLRAGFSVPFASGLRFLHTSALWKNVSFNSAPEAIRRLRGAGLAGDVMGPGDRIAPDGALRRVSPVLERDEELAAIAAHARATPVGAAAAPDDVVGRFRAHLLGLWRDTRAKLPGVSRHVIAYVVVGPPDRRFYFDFSRADDDVFQWGEPAAYDMRYTYPAPALHRTLAGEIDWDDLHFAGEVTVHQVRYARDFYRMLRSESLDLG